MIVMKFGGSSIGTPQAVRAAAETVATEKHRHPVIVVSALYGVTDFLMRAGKCAEVSDENGMRGAFKAIEQTHHDMAEVFGMPVEVTALLSACRALLQNMCETEEVSEDTWAELLSFGERMSVHLVASAFRTHGLDAVPVNAQHFIRLKGKSTNADVDFAETISRTKTSFSKISKTHIPVVTGFIGEDTEGTIKLLGRGGSDYTASILAEALEAEEVVICKEVDGILSADPRIVKNAGLLSRISYDEAAEMSHFGAKVLHPKTMIPAVRGSIPIRIRNTFNREAPGTIVSKETDPKGSGVKSVSAFRGLSMITLEGKGMAGIAGFAASLFSIAGTLGVNIVMFTQASSEQTICLVVTSEDAKRLESALKESYDDEIISNTIDAIRIIHDVAAIAVVGDGMRGQLGIAGKVFSAVAESEVNVLAIAQGSSERNISFVVNGVETNRVIIGMHSKLKLAAKVPAL